MDLQMKHWKSCDGINELDEKIIELCHESWNHGMAHMTWRSLSGPCELLQNRVAQLCNYIVFAADSN